MTQHLRLQVVAFRWHLSAFSWWHSTGLQLTVHVHPKPAIALHSNFCTAATLLSQTHQVHQRLATVPARLFLVLLLNRGPYRTERFVLLQCPA